MEEGYNNLTVASLIEGFNASLPFPEKTMERNKKDVSRTLANKLNKSPQDYFHYFPINYYHYLMERLRERLLRDNPGRSRIIESIFTNLSPHGMLSPEYVEYVPLNERIINGKHTLIPFVARIDRNHFTACLLDISNRRQPKLYYTDSAYSAGCTVQAKLLISELNQRRGFGATGEKIAENNLQVKDSIGGLSNNGKYYCAGNSVINIVAMILYLVKNDGVIKADELQKYMCQFNVVQNRLLEELSSLMLYDFDNRFVSALRSCDMEDDDNLLEEYRYAKKKILERKNKIHYRIVRSGSLRKEFVMEHRNRYGNYHLLLRERERSKTPYQVVVKLKTVWDRAIESIMGSKKLLNEMGEIFQWNDDNDCRLCISCLLRNLFTTLVSYKECKLAVEPDTELIGKNFSFSNIKDTPEFNQIMLRSFCADSYLKNGCKLDKVENIECMKNLFGSISSIVQTECGKEFGRSRSWRMAELLFKLTRPAYGYCLASVVAENFSQAEKFTSCLSTKEIKKQSLFRQAIEARCRFVKVDDRF